MKFLIFFIGFLLGVGNISAQNQPFTIVLDAGHGGKDPGKVQGKVLEKDIALKIVLMVGKELEKDKNFKVVYTRKTDVFVQLYERGQIANKANADLFVSVHCNASDNSHAHGAETFVLGLHANDLNFEVAKEENKVIYLEDDYQKQYADYDINSPESLIGISIVQEEFLERSIDIAKKIQHNFSKELKRRDRGVKQAGFIVLHQTYMPSVLIETGFVTNNKERVYLLSNKGQKEISKSIVKAIKSYREDVVKSIAPPSPEPVKEKNKPEKTYKIQIAVSKKDLGTNSKNFKGLSPISKQKKGKQIHYYYGEASDWAKAQELQKQAIKKGYKKAFIVTF